MEIMGKKMLIDATHAEETRVVVADGNRVEEFDFESKNKRQLAGNIYLAKVSRIESSLQAAFIDYGGNRHGFLAYSEIHPDYYQIPIADKEALLAEDLEFARKSEELEEIQHFKKIEKPSVQLEVGSADPEISQSINFDENPQLNINVADDKDDTSELVAESDIESQVETIGEITASVNDSDHIEAVGNKDDVSDLMPKRKTRSKRYRIQEVIKVRQILLIQVVKEERGNKGAALTTYLSLPGRYCVLMPNTAKGGGISRKITNLVDRKKLKEIASEIDVPKGAGLIVRTAGSRRTKSEIKRDYEYLLRQWEQVRDLTLKSNAPAPIYEEGDLIKRSIRDLYNREIDEVLIEGDNGFNVARDFMRMIMPTHLKNVKKYDEKMPLFARYQVETHLSAMFNPTVQLKSGGYIVIGITEALVAIDVNSGRATKEGSIEQTALNTNLEAAEEISRQMRLRDLAGLIVIDFIDMEERRNNLLVEKLIKEKLASDRARIQVGRISGFGLLELSRQRLRPGMLEATTQPCVSCHGTGLIRSDDSLALNILRQLEEEGTRKTSKEVLLSAPVAVINFLMNEKREHISKIELRYGLSVKLEADPHLISPNFTIEKFKIATRAIPLSESKVVSMGSVDMSDIDSAIEISENETAESLINSGDLDEEKIVLDESGEQPKKRRRRRRRGGKTTEKLVVQENEAVVASTSTLIVDQPVAEVASELSIQPSEAEPTTPVKVAKKRNTRVKPKPVLDVDLVDVETNFEEPTVDVKPKTRKRAPNKVSDTTISIEPVIKKAAGRKKDKPTVSVEGGLNDGKSELTDNKKVQQKPKGRLKKAETVSKDISADDEQLISSELDKPKRTGWWSSKA